MFLTSQKGVNLKKQQQEKQFCVYHFNTALEKMCIEEEQIKWLNVRKEMLLGYLCTDIKSSPPVSRSTPSWVWWAVCAFLSWTARQIHPDPLPSDLCVHCFLSWLPPELKKQNKTRNKKNRIKRWNSEFFVNRVTKWSSKQLYNF